MSKFNEFYNQILEQSGLIVNPDFLKNAHKYKVYKSFNDWTKALPQNISGTYSSYGPLHKQLKLDAQDVVAYIKSPSSPQYQIVGIFFKKYGNRDYLPQLQDNYGIIDHKSPTYFKF